MKVTLIKGLEPKEVRDRMKSKEVSREMMMRTMKWAKGALEKVMRTAARTRGSRMRETHQLVKRSGVHCVDNLIIILYLQIIQ